MKKSFIAKGQRSNGAKGIFRFTLFAFWGLCVAVSVHAQDAPITPPEIMRIGGGVVSALAWHPNGETLIVGSSTGAYRLDDELNLEEKLTDGSVTALAWGPDGAALAIAEQVSGVEPGDTLCSLKIQDESGTSVFEPDFCAQTLVWSPDAANLVLLNDSRVKILHLADSMVVETGVPARSAAWSPDGTQLALGAHDTLFIWNAEANTLDLARAGQGYGDVVAWTDGDLTLLCYEKSDTRDAIKHCVFEPQTGVITEQAVILWQHPGQSNFPDHIRTNKLVFAFVIDAEMLPSIRVFDAETDYMTFLSDSRVFAFKPGERVAAYVTSNGTLHMYDLAADAPLFERDLVFTSPLSSVAWSPNGTQLAASSYGYDQMIRTWGLNPDNASYTDSLSIHAIDAVNNVAWTPDSREIVGWGTIVTDIIMHSNAEAWDAKTGERTRPIDGVYTQFDALPLTAWNSDFTRGAFTAAESGTVIFDEKTIKTAAPLVNALAWSMDSNRLATLSTADETAIVEVWNTETGARISTSVQTGVIELDSRIWWSDSGELLLVSGRHRDYEAFSVWVYEAATGRLVLRYGTPQFYPPKIAWKPDDTLIAVETDTAIVFLSTETGKPTAEQIPTSYINWLDWSPDGRSLAGAGADGTIYVWDVSEVTPVIPVQTDS